MTRRRSLRITNLGMRVLALALLLAAVPSLARDRAPPTPAMPPSGVVGVEDAYLSAAFWTARLQAPGAVLMPPAAIAARNQRLFQTDGSMHNIARLPATLERAHRGSFHGHAVARGLAQRDRIQRPVCEDSVKRSLRYRLAVLVPQRLRRRRRQVFDPAGHL